jgi:hypothetical protein
MQLHLATPEGLASCAYALVQEPGTAGESA